MSKFLRELREIAPITYGVGGVSTFLISLEFNCEKYHHKPYGFVKFAGSCLISAVGWPISLPYMAYKTDGFSKDRQ